jgi:hypothetical protein
MVALSARHARVAAFGVRQHGYRSSRARCPARGTPLPPLVTGMLDVLVTIMGLVSNEITPDSRFLKEVLLFQMVLRVSGGLATFPTGSLAR